MPIRRVPFRRDEQSMANSQTLSWNPVIALASSSLFVIILRPLAGKKIEYQTNHQILLVRIALGHE